MQCRRLRPLCRSLITGAILFLVMLPNAFPTRAASDQEIEHAIDTVLAERHPTDTPDWWRSLGPTAPRVILRMLKSSDRVYHRVRLTQALGWFDDPEVVDYLKTQARETKEDVVRNAAVRSVGNSQGAKEFEFIAEFLEHADPQTRLSAAEALQKIDNSEARERLKRFMAEEKAGWLVARLKGELPKPTAKLSPVSSSEDRLSPEWEGRWMGYWLVPRSKPDDKAKAPLEPVQAVSIWMQLKITRVVELSGAFREKIPGDKKESVYSLSRASGKRKQISGILESTAVKPALVIPFSAELVLAKGEPAIELRSVKTGAIGLLMRDNSPQH
ncbi:MAG: hypothetical protein A2X94_05945 [Bdellovibrionales bacterium GWB1_55_8]|nr:MAG: hypothetical protein A2X94_05945 [Bdellovibrionales bacterium GWB1_55_8]